MKWHISALQKSGFFCGIRCFLEGVLLTTDIDIRRITTIGIMAALSVVLAFLIHFSIFPQASFLEYDPADIPILVVTFAYGPVSGLIVAVTASIVQGVTVSMQSGIYGILMHVISVGSYVLAAGLVYRTRPSRLSAGISLFIGVFVSTAIMVIANLVITI